MQILLILALVIVVILFGLSSVSQSYASAQQAQAAIEASRAVQIASTGNLVIIITVLLLAVALLAAVAFIAWLFLRRNFQPKRQWTPGPNANWGQISQPQANDLLPALLTMLLYQMLQNKKQQDFEPMMLDEPVDELLAVQDDFWRM